MVDGDIEEAEFVKADNEKHWEMLLTEGPEYLQTLAPFHTKGYVLQIYRIRRMDTDLVRFNSMREEKWRKYLMKLNDEHRKDVGTAKLVEKYLSLNLLYILIVNNLSQNIKNENVDLENIENGLRPEI
jgi:hypothetical protein